MSGLTTLTPRHSIAQADAASKAISLSPQERGPELLRELYRRSGVEKRHSVLIDDISEDGTIIQSFYPTTDRPEDLGPTTLERMERYEKEAGALALRAARQALDSSGIRPDQVTHIVSVSCTGFYAPGLDLELIEQLGLPPETSRTNVGFMGCHGVMNGLRVALAYAEADPKACVLVCAVELCSLHHQYTQDAQQIVANALFADGAASVLVHSRDLTPGQTEAASSDSQPRWLLRNHASYVIPKTAYMMSWRIGDHGFQMTLSPRVPDAIRSNLRAWLDNWLASQGLTIEEVAGWAIHPGGPRILSACADAAGFDPELLSASQEVLTEFGNMSSPTALFVLDRIDKRIIAGPCVMMAFGPGLTVEAALLEKR